jgi:hypothetical protein
MLFKVYCALDWINYRSISLEEHTNIVEIARRTIYEALTEMNNLHDEELITLVALTLASDTGSYQLDEGKLASMIAKARELQRESIMDQITANQMVYLLCLNFAFQSKTPCSS